VRWGRCDNTRMSIEVYVLLDRSRLPTRDDWQHQLDEADISVGLDLALQPCDASGFQPMTFRNEPTGCEVYVGDVDRGTCPEGLVPYLNDRHTLATFRWGGNLTEMAVGLAAASTLAVLTDGIYLDPQDEAILEGPAALVVAQSELANL
jgi:hypothetical protein